MCHQAASLTSNGYPDRALALISQVRAGGGDAKSACEGERLSAIGAEQEGVPTFAQRAESTWSTWYTRSAEPLTAPALAFLGAWLALVFLSWLLTLLPVPLPEQIFGTEHRTHLKLLPWLAAAGMASIILAAAAWALLLPTMREASLGFVAALTLLSLFGIALWAYWSAARLRLNIAVSIAGANSPAAAAHITALVRFLGGAEAQGIEIPQGTDVDTLKDTGFTTTPTNRILAALLSLAQILLPRSPWRVSVDAVTPGKDEPDGALTVAMTRNRKSVASAVIDRAALTSLLTSAPTPDPSPAAPPAPGTRNPDPQVPELDLHLMAAAFILVTLSQHYDQFHGLCGAKEWRSVGLYALATSDPCFGTRFEAPLLAAAVDADRDNVPAQVAFRRALWRKSTKAADLDEFADWLVDALSFVKDKTGRDNGGPWWPLQLRIERLLTVARTNRRYAAGPPPAADTSTADAARDLLLDLVSRERALQQDQRSAGEISLVRLLMPSAAAMYLGAHAGVQGPSAGNVPPSGGPPDAETLETQAKDILEATDPTEAAPKPRADTRKLKPCWNLPPEVLYNLACYFATRQPEPDAEEAMRLLAVAAQSNELAQWSRQDPQLRTLRASPLWRQWFPDSPRSDILTIEPFASQQTALRAAGLVHAVAIRSARRRWLIEVLDVDSDTVKRLQAAALAAERLQSRAPQFYVELVQELQQRDLARWPVPATDELRNQIAASLAGRLSDAPTATDLEQVLSP